MKTKRIALIIAVAVLVGAIFWSLYKGPLWNRDSGEDLPSLSIESNILSGEVDGDSPEMTYGYVKASSTQKDMKPTVGTPSLNRPIAIPKSFSPEMATSAKERIGAIIEMLKKNPENAVVWADLGMARKGIEDYEGSKEAYAYALKLQPNNSVVAENLGVIYADYLKDYPKAEQYFRLSITLDPSVGYRYLRLFEFYRYLLKDAQKAKAILEEGLRAIPNDPSLKVLLETF